MDVASFTVTVYNKGKKCKDAEIGMGQDESIKLCFEIVLWLNYSFLL